MIFPDRIAAELLAHEHLQQQVAGRLQRGVGDEELDGAAAVFEVDAQAEDDSARLPSTLIPRCPNILSVTNDLALALSIGVRGHL